MGSSRDVVGRAGLITQGLNGAIFSAIVEPALVMIQHGRSAVKQKIEKIIVSAKLIRVNGSMTTASIYGQTSILVEKIKNVSVKLTENVKLMGRKAIKIVAFLKSKDH